MVQFKERKFRGGRAYRQCTEFKEFIRERDGRACQKCGATIDGITVKQIDVSHIVPHGGGGMTTPDNVRVLCHSCNVKEKPSKRESGETLDDYFAYIERELAGCRVDRCVHLSIVGDHRGEVNRGVLFCAE